MSYDPEYNWNYEAGVKGSWLKGKLSAAVSLFYIDINDKQVSEWNSATMTRNIYNAAKAHSQGAELQIEAIPLAGLELFVGIGYALSQSVDVQRDMQ